MKGTVTQGLKDELDKLGKEIDKVKEVTDEIDKLTTEIDDLEDTNMTNTKSREKENLDRKSRGIEKGSQGPSSRGFTGRTAF